MAENRTYTAFAGHELLAHGAIEPVALQVKAWADKGGESVLLFEDATGQQLDLDLRGSDAEVLERLKQHPWLKRHDAPDEKRGGPGRPKLGVVSREISLLPRHWDWLSAQRGGASVTIRSLVETQMKSGSEAARAQQAKDAASKFLWAMAGNLPGFEEASRAFTRQEYARFDELIEAWPAAVREHVRGLLKAIEVQAREASA